MISPILTLDIFDVTILGMRGRVLVVILSPAVALAAGILACFKLHENWLSYRLTWEALKYEEHFQNLQIFEYEKADDRNKLFVERVEMLIFNEEQEWLCRQMKKEHKKRKTMLIPVFGFCPTHLNDTQDETKRLILGELGHAGIE